MPNPGVGFGGKNIILPGAYSIIRTSQQVGSSQGIAPTIAILGDATGGAPGVPQFFRNGDDAKRLLRSGPLLDAIRLAYDPNAAPDQPGADLVVAIRLNPATQSTLALLGGSGTLITLTSRDYGAWTTGIQVKVEAGTTSGKKITLQYVDSELGTILEVYDNLANGPAAVAAINSGLANGQAASQFVTAASGGGTEALATLAFTPLASGVEGTTTSTQWTNALVKLEMEDVDLVVPVSNDAAIHAMVQTHVETLSGTDSRRERIAILGAAPVGGFGTQDLYVADLVSRAVALASSRVCLVAPGFKRSNASGVLTSYGSEYLAAQVAGMVAGLEIGQSVTHKYAKLNSIDVQFTNTQLKTLLLAGVVPVEFRKNRGFRVVQGLTTYQLDANPMFRQMSVRLVGDFLMKTLRTRLEDEFVGVRGDDKTADSMVNSTASVLEQAKRDRIITNYQAITIKIVSGTVRVSFEFSPTEPIDYILIEGFAKPASLSVTFTGQASFSGATG